MSDDNMFTLVKLFQGHAMTCKICGCLVSLSSGKIHRMWHKHQEENDE